MAPSPWGLSFMVAPTTLADLVRFPPSSFIWYMVYRSFRWEGLKPSISGMAREMMTDMA